MEQYWDCSLCRVENKGRAFRCRSCYGKLRGRDRLLREAAEFQTRRRKAARLSALAAGLGQIYARRWLTGFTLGILIPLAVGLVAVTWRGFTYGHLFVAAAAGFVLAVAVVDAFLGPRSRTAPCQLACPAHLAIPDYLQLILDGEYDQGLALVRTRVPLAGLIGRVCPHPCEARCTRGIDGEPIAINACKRFLSDAAGGGPEGTAEKAPGAGAPGPRVAVVGSGPAGLSCAYYLTVLGARVTVYEADPVLGGRPATTIPDYRLPSSVVEAEVQDLRRRGIAFRPGTPVGPGGIGVAQLLEEHDALFLGVGAAESVGLDVPGGEGAVDFQEFLRAVKAGDPPPVGPRVAVIGGGNAALDVCRSALRLGAEEVHLLYRRSRDEMPGREDEVEEAMREGVRFHFLADLGEVRCSGGRLEAVRVCRMRLGEPDASGRPRPVPVEGDEWELEIDTCVPALGQRVAGGVFADEALAGLRREPDGRVRVDPGTGRTSLPRVYAGGDAVSGPSTAVEAVAQGRRAALALFAALCPDRMARGALTDRRIPKPFPGHRETPEEKIREEMPRLSLRARCEAFREVEEGFRPASAGREAGRCLQCHRGL